MIAIQPVPQEAKSRIRQANEADILRAAEQVFARAGYGGATMNEIAERAGLPKANLHYYFGSKQALYSAVLRDTLSAWLAGTDAITPQADPREALSRYIRAKMALTAQRPDASRVFANELLHGAAEIGALLRGELRALVREKARVIDGWIAQGRMAPVDSTHLFFTIWAATQTYADFETQVIAVLGKRRLARADLERATEHVLTLVLRGCGLHADSGTLLAPA
ncbi:MAG TPA: TetR/AcrR family transcriptional regulator [Ideonella sp.]|nr:TetR/AcrR family transcriptional regulator [Ideonella sp.]